MKRTNRSLWAVRISARRSLLIPLAALFAFVGCGEQPPNAPDPGGDQEPAEAPVLPDPGYLSIDLSFFDDGEEKVIGRQNFYNAYLRTVIVTAVTRLVLTPPVAAFALALHTVPTPQPDGSWLWVYTYVRGTHEVQVRLRGTVQDEGIAWSLRLTALADGLTDALWFDGTTQNEGRIGNWTFYDVHAPAQPAVAAVTWNNQSAGHELRLQVLQGASAGDVLTFTVDGPQHRIDYLVDATQDTWFVRWNVTDNTGSLQVPVYRNGVESCWDEQLFDVDCGK